MLTLTDQHALLLVLTLPLMGALFISLSVGAKERESAQNAKLLALWFMGITFVASLYLLGRFDPEAEGLQFRCMYSPFVSKGVNYELGIDGLSMLFLVLITFLMPLCMLASWGSIKRHVKGYAICMLVMETLMLLVFVSQDLFLFYLTFEASLIPMLFIIGIWGGENRIYATFKFFFYTLLGSVLMLLAIITMYFQTGTTSFAELSQASFSFPMQIGLFLAFFLAFAVKLPMFPVHTWLPDAHVEAPTAGSMILAAVLLKMGGYGFLRFCLPMFPEASHFFTPAILALSIVAILYASVVALVQKDMKKLVAYSSISHMGFVTLGIFSGTLESLQGAVFIMINHGLVSSGMFLCVGTLYDRMHTRLIEDYGGVAKPMPIYATFFLLLTMANIGLPGTSGFVGEFLSLLGTFPVNKLAAVLACFGVVLSAAYALYLYRRVAFSQITHETLQTLEDLSWRERCIFLPLCLLILFFGFFPGFILQFSHRPVHAILSHYGR